MSKSSENNYMEITAEDYEKVKAMFLGSFSLGSRLEFVRKKRKMTQKELGIRCGFSESTADVRIRQYESDSVRPKEDIVNKMASVLNVPVETFSYTEEGPFSDRLVQFLHWGELFGFISFDSYNPDKETFSIKIENPYLRSPFFNWNIQKEAYASGNKDCSDYDEWLMCDTVKYAPMNP